MVNCDSSFRIIVIGEMGQGEGGGRELVQDIIEFLEEMVGVDQVIIKMAKKWLIKFLQLH